MSVAYKPVLWDRVKIGYDIALILVVAAYLYFYLRLNPGTLEHGRPIDHAILRMRAFGSCAFLMLSAILMIGPLARLDARFLPLLYNRRHFGVLTATIAAAHAVFVIDWYFNFSATPSWVALLSANTSTDLVLGFPFELLGIGALGLLILLAVTSHDFWLRFLTPPVWKALHMSVYAAYTLVVGHVALGYLQDVEGAAFPALFVGLAGAVVGLHIAAAMVEARRERRAETAAAGGWMEVADWRDIEDGRAKIVSAPGGERIAIYRHKGALWAITNVCAHQQGPLGEGRILHNCVTCPWHGHQFRPEDGCAPAPFTDRVAVYRMKAEAGRAYVATEPEPLGAARPGLTLEEI